MANVFTHAAGPERDKQIAATKAWVDTCAALGAPAIRVFTGNLQPGQTMEQAQKNSIESLEEACAYAGSKGVLLAVENHGGIVAEADSLLTIVKGVKSEWCGINLDTGNFHTEDVYGDRSFDVMPDGEHFLMFEPDPAAAPELRVIRNWAAELKATVQK